MAQQLSFVMANTKLKLNTAFNKILEESNLPAYLYEGLLLDILSEVRNRKNMEMVAEINAMQESAETVAKKEE